MEIDVSAVRTTKQLHNLLFKTFNLPETIRKDWDTFDDCMRNITVPGIIQISHFSALQARLPDEAEFMSRSLETFSKSHKPKITVHIR